MTTVAAVDLGASSGRVILGRVVDGKVTLHESNRFRNGPIRVGETLHWDILRIWRGLLDGLRAAGREAGTIDAVGIDAWAVDYGLLDESGTLLGNPVHYRDARTTGIMERVLLRTPANEIYATTGVQFLPINTLYQLVAAAEGAGRTQLMAASQLLLIPDLLGNWLSGARVAEITNASTTQLLDIRRRTWATTLMGEHEIRHEWFAPLVEPGDVIGELRGSVLEDTGLAGRIPLIAVGSHDTASAVVGVPAAGPGFAYISCGTWSLVGVELDHPVLTADSLEANFTNELGVDGTVRYLRNVMGLWLLQECLREWNSAGLPADLPQLLHDAARVPAFTAVVDPDAPEFLTPGDMPSRIAAACTRLGQEPPQSQPEVVRCILDSLALAYRRRLRQAQALSGQVVDVVHIVGGGARNQLLCQLTADACNLPVVAGPAEAAAIGNILVQARSLGAMDGGLHELRAVVRRSEPLHTYQPSGDDRGWAAAEARAYSDRVTA
jgi:rhamnulokinase